MKFSTKGRYGLRALIDLAVYSENEHVSLGSIAQRQEISMNYLEQVFSVMRKAGLVKSVKGAQGGYILNVHPSKITAGSILRVLEGELSVFDGEAGDVEERNPVIQKSLLKNVWEPMNECLNKTADSVTLQQLADEYRRKNGLYQAMYYI